jgi:hypothetical protein
MRPEPFYAAIGNSEVTPKNLAGPFGLPQGDSGKLTHYFPCK